MFELYCPLDFEGCTKVPCSQIADYLTEDKCCCLSEDELALIKKRIADNYESIIGLKYAHVDCYTHIFDTLTPILTDRQKQISDNFDRIGLLTNKLYGVNLKASNNKDDIDGLGKKNDKLRDLIDKDSDAISNLQAMILKNKAHNKNDDTRLNLIEQLVSSVKGNTDNNSYLIRQIINELYANKIYVPGISDPNQSVEDGGTGDSGGAGLTPGGADNDDANGVVNVYRNNTFQGDNVFNGDTIINSPIFEVNTDIDLRYDFAKGGNKSSTAYRTIYIRDNAGSLVQDNIAEFGSSISNAGFVSVFMRAYQNVNNSSVKTAITLNYPKSGTPTFVVDPDTTVNGTLTVKKDTALQAKLNVTGASVLGSTLQVNGAGTFKSTVDVVGNAVFEGTLSVLQNYGFAKTPPLNDSSKKIVTTEWIDKYMNQFSQTSGVGGSGGSGSYSPVKGFFTFANGFTIAWGEQAENHVLNENGGYTETVVLPFHFYAGRWKTVCTYRGDAPTINNCHKVRVVTGVTLHDNSIDVTTEDVWTLGDCPTPLVTHIEDSWTNRFTVSGRQWTYSWIAIGHRKDLSF